MNSPISHSVWALSALACLAILVLWLALGEYSRRERVKGQLVSSQGLLTAKSRHSGQVREIKVKEGQLVADEAPLLTIGSEQYTQDASAVGERVRSALKEQKTTIKAEMDSADAITRIKREGLIRQIALVREQIERSSSASKIYERDVADQRALVERTELLLAQGYISVTEVQRFRSAAATAEAAMVRQLSERAAIEQQLKSLEVDLASLPIDAAIAMGAAQREMTKVSVDIDLSDAGSESVIRAPSSGIVSKVMIHQGDNVDEGQPLLAIMPAGASLEAEFFVPSSAIGLLRIGNKVAIRYSAFPYQKFGTQSGRVTEISKSAFTLEEQRDSFGILNAAEPRYRIKVGLDQQRVNAAGELFTLSPGMDVEADIEVEKRRLYQWLLQPASSLSGS